MMMFKRAALLSVLYALIAATDRAAISENWPTWRGVNGDGILHEGTPPTKWDRETNVKWRIKLPEPGNSTPIVWEDRVFVTQPVDGGRRRTVMCFDHATGQTLWHSGLDAVEMERSHETNPYCSPSPVTDGERVICWFGSTGLVAYDMDGKQLWHRPLGQVDHVFGYGQSPVIHGDLCYLNFGPGAREFAVAVDKKTGEIVWQYDAPRPGGTVDRSRDILGMWSTPIVFGDELIFCFRDAIIGFEPLSGRQLWICHGLGPQMKSSPVAGEGVVVALGGRDSAELAVRTGGTGNVTDTHVLWKRPHAQSRLGTGVIHDGHLYANKRNGIVECIDLRTGEVVWEKRHAGPGNNSNTWASLTLAGGKIYAINQSADVFVLDASPTYNLVATNSLDEHTNSSVAPSQGSLFIRTHEALWCIGN